MVGLPAELSGFVGRRAEAAQVKRLLAASRLVTLTGPGGVGKTRLALHVARGSRRAFPDGVYLVELAAVEDPALLPNAVAAALDLPDTTGGEVAAVLEARLANLRALIVLDNCEHLVASAAALARRLLARSEAARLLVTSREPLGVSGEHVLAVPPLSLPAENQPLPPERALDSDAVALFVERAAAVVHGFALGPTNQEAIARLCRRLDGLPLAIELAAARLRVLSPEQILARLDTSHDLLAGGSRTAPARHQSLRALAEWSFELCSERERTLWTRLSVFADGFDLAAAERVSAGPGIDGSEVLDVLAGLVEKSVLIRDEAEPEVRYRMLSTIRAFGRQRLAASGERPALRARHRQHYLALAARAEADWFGPRQPEWLHRFQLEQPDLWAALGSGLQHAEAEEPAPGAGEPAASTGNAAADAEASTADAEASTADAGDPATADDLAAALWWFWVNRAVRDGRHWLDRVLGARPGASAKARRVNGWLALAHGDAPSAARLLDGPPDGVSVLERALAEHRAGGALDAMSGLVWCNLPTVARLLGEPERADALCREWLRVCAAAGERWASSWALWVLAVARWRAGAAAEAHEHATEALRRKRELGDQLGIPPAIGLLAGLTSAQGNPKRAAFLFGASERLWEPVGRPVFGWGTFRDWVEQWRARTRDLLGGDAFERARASGRGVTVDQAMAHALGERPDQRTASASRGERVLTRRELEVARLVAQGRSNREIAKALVISPRTAETHVENILGKLGFASRSQIAAWVSRR